MAVYVLLEFPNDEEAKLFVKGQMTDWDEVDTSSYEGSPTHLVQELDSTIIRAVWQKPTAFCNCVHTSGWTRGKKYGWWACATCGKPSAAWARGDCWYTALGTNLVPRECLIKPEWRSPTWRNKDTEWTFLLPKETENEH